MHVHPEVAQLLGRLCELAIARRPDDPLLPLFLGEYYCELAGDDADERHLDDVYGAAVAHFTLGRVRAPGRSLVRLVSPERERDGWRSEHSVLLVITDDMPFLVDTLRMVLDRRGLGIHLLVHPMLAVERDDKDALLDVRFDDGTGVPAPDAAPGAHALVEAWTQIELDRVDDEVGRQLEREIATAVEDVRRVVSDFGAMRARLEGVAGAGALLSWLADGHFVFLGSSVYDRASDGTVEVREGTQLGLSRDNPRAVRPRAMPGKGPVVIARTDDVSRVFRAQRQTVVAVRPQGPAADSETRFVGLLATSAYRVSALDIPGIGAAVADRLALTEERMHSHAGRETRNVLENLPRDLLLEQSSETIAGLVTDIVGLQERRLVRVFEVPDPVGPWTTVLVYLPRARFTADLPEKVADVVADAYGTEERTFEPYLAASTLARIAVSVRRPSASARADIDALERTVDEVSTSWNDHLKRSLIRELGDEQGRRWFERVGANAPASYRAVVAPDRAIDDLRHIVELLDGDRDLIAALAHDVDAGPGEWRMRVYRRGAPATLAELMPLLDHLGLQALDERPATFHAANERVHLYDIGVRVPGGVEIDTRRRVELQRAFALLVAGDVESDGFNRLVLLAGLTAGDVTVLRGYGRYLRQIGFSFSQTYVEATLAAHPALVADLVDLFHARFDPAAGADRAGREAAVRARVVDSLDAIPSLDEDRICRAFLTLIDATVRTNHYRGRPYVAFKFDPGKIPELPRPRPVHEVWVCGPRVEGVHLRGGDIARGGLRWSDRREDFRTEVLGLMKAQMVKNAVIVPAGAKGGFVVKRPPADLDAMRTEVVECYRAFISGLLDLTDNRIGGPGGDRIVHPPDTVVHDGDDPYLVVAADKGTATFSDIANDISLRYGFWLGDAFASGGSTGYDHKAMGITARGAWESVRRHARVLGKDADHDPLTAVGIGDMSGDVFGNGMLRSPALRLVAAFDHRHVFVDPDPDPAVSFEERRRLFALPRSSWGDYDHTLLSPGGGVYQRTLKAIEISDGARRVLDAPVGPLTPTELIAAILRAPVDLLWNGGIGTYVKASTESNADVGDRANDALRVDGDQLRCRIVGEGGNLGLTQRGRVEYALNGGLVNTDAIDNSAGVDCSDHEVNVKILLDGIVDAGELIVKQRNALLASMTGEVADLVLDNNRAQTLALTITRRQALPMVNVHARYLDVLEAEGWLDRGLEFLPTDKQIAERQSAGAGLQAPEFAVLMAYTKNVNTGEIVQSDLPDSPLVERDLIAYFPGPLRQRYADAIRAHPLRRELTATLIGNQMVNLSGISFDHRMTEDTGASVVDVTRAWVASRDIFGFPRLWAEIDELDDVPLETQLDLFLDCRRMVERGALWLLRHRRPPLDMVGAVVQFGPGIEALAATMESALAGRMRAIVHSGEASRLAAGVPEELAERAGVWPLLHTGFDLVEVAEAHGRDVSAVARVHWQVFDRLDLVWLWEGIGGLPRSDRWQTQARSALRDDLLTALAELTTAVIDRAGGSVDAWVAANARTIARTAAMFTEIRRAESYDLTTLSVALRQVRNLALTTVAG